MFTRIIRINNKYRIKSWFWPVAAYLCDSGTWWRQTDFYVKKYCNFNSIEEAEIAWAKYKSALSEYKKEKKCEFVKLLK